MQQLSGPDASATLLKTYHPVSAVAEGQGRISGRELVSGPRKPARSLGEALEELCKLAR